MATVLTGYGPSVGAQIITPPEEVEEKDNIYTEYNLERLAPIFDLYDGDLIHILKSADKNEFPQDPSEMSASRPEVIDFMFEVPGVEPDLSFRDFIKGAAMASLLVDPAYREGVKAAATAVGERVINGGELPALSIDFYDEVMALEEKLFANGEPVSWMPLLSFMRGAFWVLGFMISPKGKVGKYSPLSMLVAVCEDSINLGYINS